MEEETRPSDNPYHSPLAEVAKSSDQSPLLSIWFRPRETIRRIITGYSERVAVLLYCVAGIQDTWSLCKRYDLGDNFPLSWIVLIGIVLGPARGLVQLYVSAYLLEFTGQWREGKAERSQLRAALAWASVPDLILLLLWAPMLVIFGISTFTSAGATASNLTTATIRLVLSILMLVFSIWSLFLAANTVAEVQGYRSAWKAVWNFVLATLVVMAAILPFALVAVLLR